MGLSTKWSPRKDREKYTVLGIGLFLIVAPMFIPLIEWWVKIIIASFNSFIAIFVYIKIASLPNTVTDTIANYLNYQSRPKDFVRGGVRHQPPEPIPQEKQKIFGLRPSHAGIIGLVILAILNIAAYFGNGPLQEWLSSPTNTRAETIAYKSIEPILLNENDYQRIYLKATSDGKLQVNNDTTTWEIPVARGENIVLAISSHQLRDFQQVAINATFSYVDGEKSIRTLWLLPLENSSIDGRISCENVNKAYFQNTAAQEQLDVTTYFSEICPTADSGAIFEVSYVGTRPAWLVIDGNIEYVVANSRDLFENAFISAETHQ